MAESGVAGGRKPANTGGGRPTYASPAIPSQRAMDLAGQFVPVSYTLCILSTLLFGARLYTRVRPVLRFGWDDYFAIVGFAFLMTNTGLLVATCDWYINDTWRTKTLGDSRRSFKLSIISQPLWQVAMTLIKISVCCMILRVQRDRYWRYVIYGMVALQVTNCIYGVVTQLTQCIPLQDSWDILSVKKSNCYSAQFRRISTYVSSIVNIITDIVLSVLPVTFLRKIQRPLRERIIIGLLMGLGLVASGASIAKTVGASRLGTTGDGTWEGMVQGTWSVVEEHLAFIACCIPCLKSPFQQALQYFGLVTVTDRSQYGNGRYGQVSGERGNGLGYKNNRANNSIGGGHMPGHGSGIPMKSMGTANEKDSSDTQSEDNILPNAAAVGKHNGGILRTTEVRLSDNESDRSMELPRHGATTRPRNPEKPPMAI